jgi:WD40 repeat protein
MTKYCKNIQLLLLFAVTSSAAAADRQDSPPQKTPKLDLYGDPLPAGAIARIGSIRLRHTGLSDLVYLPDGKTIISAGADRVLRWWDRASGKPMRDVKLQGVGGPGFCQTLSPDGKFMVAQDAQALVFWEVATGKELKKLPTGAQNSVMYLYFSPDSKTLAVHNNPTSVILWDWMNDKQKVLHMPGQQNGGFIGIDSSQHGYFSHDGKMFGTGGGMQQPLILWEVATGKEIRRIDCAASISTFSPDDKWIAASCSKAGGGPTSFRIFEVATGKELIQKDAPQAGFFWWVDVAPDGKSVAFVDQRNIYVCDRETLKERLRIPAGVRQVFFSPDNKWLMGNHGNRIRIWDASTGKETTSFPGMVYGASAVAMSSDGKKVATGTYSWGEPAALWDAATGRHLHDLNVGEANGYVSGVCFSSDNKNLLAGTTSAHVLFWDADTGKQIRNLHLNDPALGNPNNANFQRLHVTSDGKRVCTFEQTWGPMGQSNQLACWDLANGKVVKQVPLPVGQEPVWSPDGNRAAYLGQDGVTIIDIATGQTAAHIEGHWLGNLAMSPDGSLLAARMDRAVNDPGPSIIVWEALSGKKVGDLPAGQPHSWVLAADNRTVVTIDAKSIRVWDLASKQEKLKLELPTASVIGPTNYGMRATAHLTPNGRRLLTPESDGTFLIWDLSAALATNAAAPANVEVDRVAGWWSDLAKNDPAVAYAAIWKLTDVPADAVALFQKQMKPAVDADFDRVRKLIKELDDDRFEVREAASKTLEKMGAGIQPAARQALEGRPSPEVRRRLEALIQTPASVSQTPELLRNLRAIGILEQIGSKDARQLLTTLSSGVPHASETQAARSALERLALRQLAPDGAKE